MNILNFHNILALLDIHDYFPKCENILVHKGKRKFFKSSTEIEIPQSVNGDDYSDNAPQWINHIYHGITVADYNRTEYVSLDDVCGWMLYCTHHSHMDAPQYVHVDVSS